jgi:hypothetical protein
MKIKYDKKFRIAIACIIGLDLILKALIIQSFEPTEMKEIISGVFSVGRIETLRGAFGFQNSVFLLFASHLVFQIMIVLLAVRIYKRGIHPLFNIALLMIIAGWVAEYLDWIFFGAGRITYVYTEYFYFHFLDPVFSISSVMITLGWLFFLFSSVVFFKQLKLVFQRIPREQVISES